MLHEFLDRNRTELIGRCRAKVALRSSPPPTATEMEHGIPLFLDQLIDALRAEPAITGIDVPRGPKRPRTKLSQRIDESAARHGSELLDRGFSVEQVVHDYGDLCQAITELASEEREVVGAEEFRVLNGCLDDAIAGAVTEFGLRRDQQISGSGDRAFSQRMGYIAHELRNCLNAAVLAYGAIKEGHVGLRGTTSQVLETSLAGLREIIDRPFVDLRLTAGEPPELAAFPLEQFVTNVRLTSGMEAKRAGCELVVESVEPGLRVKADKPMLYSALSNLLANAFAFTRPKSEVVLRVRTDADRVLIEVQDQCPGLPAHVIEALSRPAENPASGDGNGHGLSIARRAVESMGGYLRARALASGCVFTIDLPRFLSPAESRP